MTGLVRRCLVLASAVTAVACAAALVALRSGRPLYYTDGTLLHSGVDLARESMLVWDRPEPAGEIPGPVEGRVQPLADGRLVYGQVQADGTSDLVVFDPQEAALGARPLAGLNSPQHDFAPALHADGSLWFASDRPGGQGGLDLWVAPPVPGVGAWAPPRPAAAGCNTENDEADPAPGPGGELAFVREGALWLLDAAGGEPRLLLPMMPRGAIDRDPAFAPDGVLLWFVRQQAGGRSSLQRAWRHGKDGFDLPVASRELGLHGALRSPAPQAQGYELLLVQPGDQALLYVARAREVYPWWPGQYGLEQLLLFGLLFSLLVLALLLLGIRWRQLDFVTWCLLVSLLLHLLLLVLFGDLQILRRIPEPGPLEGALEIQLVDAGERGGGGEGPAADDLVASLQFQARQDPIGAEAPGVSLEASAPRALAGPTLAEPMLTRNGVEAPRVEVPQPDAPAARVEQSNRYAIQTAALPASVAQEGVAPVPEVLANRATPVAVQVPGSALERIAEGAPDRAPARASAPQLAAATPAERTWSAQAPRLEDAPATAPAPSRANAVAPATALLAAAAAPVAAASSPLPSPTVPTTGAEDTSPGEGVQAPGSQMQAAGRAGRTASSSKAADPALRARAFESRGPELRDAAAPSTPTAVSAKFAPAVGLQAAKPGDVVPGAGSSAGVERPLRTAAAAPATGIAVPGSFLERAPRARATPPQAPVAATSLFQGRFGAQKAQAIERYGGSQETEAAVRRGLAYLARIQNRDGSWGDRRRMHEKYGQVFIGKTALCLLAFLGAGHVPNGDTEHGEVVRRAVAFLRSVQDERSGHFGVSCAYSHGISTYALAECYGMTKDEDLLPAVEHAIDWILRVQDESRDRRSRGGWGYYSADLQPEDGFARSSVTAWQVMALEAARLAGLDVPRQSLDRAREFLLAMCDEQRGYFLYSKEPGRLRSTWRTLPASTPAAVFGLQLLGVGADDPRLRLGLDYVLERAPQEYRRYSDDEFVRQGAGNVYFWYYGSLACFLAGGEVWDGWNRALKTVVVGGQAEDGSFPPIDVYARYAGDNDRDRSYTTAMCVLSLEVYYRCFTPLLTGR